MVAAAKQSDMSMGQTDFVPQNSNLSDAATYGVNTQDHPAMPTPNASNQTPPLATSQANSSTRAVTSAKAAINAMYAERSRQPKNELKTSAREAVNAAASQAVARDSRSASNLHHGSIQRSMESTRTSASALLKVAKTEPKTPQSIKNSIDPLSKLPSYTGNKSTAEHEIPVVHTSLKLGAAARPKRTPVVLPPNARMARHATSVDRPNTTNRLTELIARNNATRLTPKTLSNNQRPALATGAGNNTIGVSRANSLPTPVHRPQGQVRDPQMLGGGAARMPQAPAQSATRSAGAVAAARPANTATGEQGITVSFNGPRSQAAASARPGVTSAAKASATSAGAANAAKAGTSTVRRRFRAAPRGYATSRAAAMPADKSYVMTTPPKLTAHKSPTPPPEFGVVEPYHQSRTPDPIGDHTPIGRLAAREYGAGHGGAAPSEYGVIKADNTSNYSFSKKPDTQEATRYALGGQSPFLKSVNVEKRPLSSNAKPKKELPSSRTPVEDVKKSDKSSKSKAKSAKASRKNQYSKDSYVKHSASIKMPDTRLDAAAARPTVIIPASRRSRVPLFFLILLTIILGAAVGAASYLCFFQ